MYDGDARCLLDRRAKRRPARGKALFDSLRRAHAVGHQVIAGREVENCEISAASDVKARLVEAQHAARLSCDGGDAMLEWKSGGMQFRDCGRKIEYGTI